MASDMRVTELSGGGGGGWSVSGAAAPCESVVPSVHAKSLYGKHYVSE
jgi:hypothetical protein